MRQFDMFEELIPKIYESPDKGETVYARDFGSDSSTRRLEPGTIGVCRAAPDGVHIVVDSPTT